MASTFLYMVLFRHVIIIAQGFYHSVDHPSQFLCRPIYNQKHLHRSARPGMSLVFMSIFD